MNADSTLEAPTWQRVLQQLQHATVRDLAFLLLSPSLLQPGYPAWEDAVAQWPADDWAAWRRWLFTQDLAPQRLQAHVAEQPAQRLGRYAEQLLGFALAHAPPELGIRLLSSHHVVAESGVTAGELDFVIERRGVVEHWELAVKFYCQQGDLSLQSFASPDGRDTLADKLQHLFERQLPLQPVAGVPRADRALAYVRGWLFYPAQSPAAGRFDAFGLHPSHPRGSWVDESEVGALKQGSWVPLPRLAWLPPATVRRDAQGHYPLLTMHGHARASLWAQVAKRSSGVRDEVQRVMVLRGAAAREA